MWRTLGRASQNRARSILSCARTSHARPILGRAHLFPNFVNELAALRARVALILRFMFKGELFPSEDSLRNRGAGGARATRQAACA
jgi:hypothetical protein